MYNFTHDHTNTQNINCRTGDKVCSTFNVAFLPTLHYDMYDIYVHVHQNKFLPNIGQEIHFSYSHFESDFTVFFMIYRYAWLLLIIPTYLFFLYRVLTKNDFNCCFKWCKLRAKQRFWMFLGFALILFNNPAHIFVIFIPTFFGEVLEMCFTSYFVILMFAYLETNFYML